MKHYNLHVSESAEHEIVNAIDYYDGISVNLGNRFLKEIGDVYEKLKNDPQFYTYIFSDPGDQFRDIKLKSFPFLIIYEIINTTVFITAVMHTGRKPLFE